MKIYYLHFKPNADVNYLHLFSLYDLADYNPATKAYDTINYTSIPKLAALLPYSAATLNRLLDNDEYKDFLSIDKDSRTITLNSSVIKESNNNCFVRLTDKEVSYLRKEKDNLLCKYYIYLKYYCSLAKKAGIKVTAETCPHYFSVTDEIIRTYDTNTKVNPPIREEIDKQAIIQGLKDGTLDCIVTDHAPHHFDDKNVEYQAAAFGISGIETSFGFAITNLYKAGVLTLNELADRMSAAPARILGLDGGEIKEGGVADIMIADLDEKWTVDPEKFVSKGKNTPFGGYQLYGAVKYTIVDGVVKYKA